MALCLPPSALACGWWGDAEQQGAIGPAVVIAEDGREAASGSERERRLEGLTLMAGRFRTGDRLPRDPERALRLLRIAAEEGHPPAQYDLARMYEQGLGTEPDQHEAAHWYLQAAQAGDVHAQHHLAEMHIAGRGVPRDLAEGARWMERAAESGHAEIYDDLAQLYWDGRGVARDPGRAYLWWRRAALAGDRRAPHSAARASERLGSAAIEAAEREVHWRGAGR
jgi:TPR repeat protein